MTRIEELVASVFGIPAERVTDDLAYDSIPEWDSLNHVKLMLALESNFGKEIDEDLMVELTTIRAIREFVEPDGGPGA
jgi:citrate synthase